MKTLEHYGGDGFDNYDEEGNKVPSETGKFEVKTRHETKSFTSLSQARTYFESIDGERFIWDMTGIPELLDGYCYPTVLKRRKRKQNNAVNINKRKEEKPPRKRTSP